MDKKYEKCRVFKEKRGTHCGAQAFNVVIKNTKNYLTSKNRRVLEEEATEAKKQTKKNGVLSPWDVGDRSAPFINSRGRE